MNPLHCPTQFCTLIALASSADILNCRLVYCTAVPHLPKDALRVKQLLLSSRSPRELLILPKSRAGKKGTPFPIETMEQTYTAWDQHQRAEPRPHQVCDFSYPISVKASKTEESTHTRADPSILSHPLLQALQQSQKLGMETSAENNPTRPPAHTHVTFCPLFPERDKVSAELVTPPSALCRNA